MPNYVINEGKLWCFFEDRLDTVNCMKIEKELVKRVKDSKCPVIFDMGEVSYISSAFLRICFQASKAAGKGNLALIHVCPDVKRILKIAGVDKHIPVK